MAFCPSCGAQAEGSFCAKCGARLAPPASGPDNAPSGSGFTEDTAPGQQGAWTPVAGPAAQPAGMADNVASTLCYVLGLITGILFLVLAPYNQNRTVRFHAFQAIFFHVAWIAFWVAETAIAMILPWSLSIVTSLLALVIWLGGVVLWVLLMVKAYQGERFKLPVLGDLAEKQA